MSSLPMMMMSGFVGTTCLAHGDFPKDPGSLSLVLDGAVDVNGRQNSVPISFSVRPMENPVDFALGSATST
ncbi:hypothetical protein [Luteolibacter sp. Populi]|uniref:hypothetical protein n=1 Tax=Luteolibacter sp. Populi TaxID=3230487 RepID=UPI003465DA16